MPGSIDVSGWAIDPDTTDPVSVHVYVDGTFAGWWVADAARPDVSAAYPGWSTDHGFDFAVPVGAGSQPVCVYAINIAAGTGNPVIGCRAVSTAPIGNLESATQRPGTIRATGWAIGPSTANPINVDFYLNGAMVGRVLASGSRPDVATAYPAFGANHGFDVNIPATGGTLCAYGIEPNGGPNTPLGCRAA